MKKIVLSIVMFFTVMFVAAQCPTFSINAPNGTVVYCSPTVVSLYALNTSSFSNVTYTWTNPITGTAVANPINVIGPTIYTVTSSAPGTTCTVTQTIQISQNVLVPSTTVAPLSRTITCNGAPATFTAISSPTTNIVGQWFSPGGTPNTGQISSPLIMQTGTPGTYTFVATNLVNGCVSTQTVSVIANTVIPTMTLVSSQGNFVNCSNPCLVFSINSSPGPAPKTYSWTNISSSITVTPLSGSYTICTPGKYVAELQDGNMCRVTQTLNIGIDTLRPIPTSGTNLGFNSYTLSCKTPSLIATGFSFPLGMVNYSWTSPPNITNSSNTINISLANITSNPTTYTVLAKNGLNGCVGRAPVLFYKDINVPPYSIVFTPSVITCMSPCVAMSPSSSSTVPVTFTFTSPPPTTTATTSGALFCTPGTYTMVYTNVTNGCSNSTTTIVPANTTPAATIAVGPISIPCGTSSTNITAGTNSLNLNYTYNWTGPVGSVMNNPNGYFTSVNMPGTYSVQINNLTNGCVTNNYVAVSQATALVVNISGQDTICSGYGTNLVTTVLGATNYSWSTGSTSNIIWVSPTVTTVYSVNVTNTVSSCSGSSSFTVYVSPCSGINEYSLNGDMKIIPNPGSGKFKLFTKENILNASIKITDNSGRLIKNIAIYETELTIDLSGLSEGLYHCILLSGEKPIRYGKLIIE